MVDEETFISVAKEHGIIADGFKRDTDTEDDVNRFLRQNRPQTLEEVSAARAWLRKYQRRSSINRSISTDVMQVRCSTTVGMPVSHGALLVALYLEGMEVKRCDPSSRDAWTNISLKLA